MTTVVDRFSSPEELRLRLVAERAGLPFLLYRSYGGTLQLLTLRDEIARVTLGRGEACDVRLERDPEVSRLHAELQQIAGSWVIADDGLSRNGTFVNGERVRTRCRLADGDVMRCGATLINFRDPSGPRAETTRALLGQEEVRLSEAQRRVLVALCRPLRDGDAYALPASNKQIAEELFLSVQGVKSHLRALFDKLGIEELPHNQKRLRLVERAVAYGLVGLRELE